MAIRKTKFSISSFPVHHILVQFNSVHTISSPKTLEETIKTAVATKTYEQIPELLISSKESWHNPNPFSFLSTFPKGVRTQVIDEILQSFIPVRPRSRPRLAYDCLLSYSLQCPDPLPLSLAIIQRTLRSGCLPIPQTRLLLSSAWLDRRCQCQSVADILLEMQSIGYHPDCSTCNYLISSLCSVDHLQEAKNVLKGMPQAACVPDLESYSNIIGAICTARKTGDAIEMMKDMVVKNRLTPRQGTVMKVMSALSANREIWKAAEMIEFLEKKGCLVGFEGYELVVEGCLECKESILAGKMVMKMTEKGYIPYINIRQKVVEGLTGVGQWEFANTVRRRFAELNS